MNNIIVSKFGGSSLADVNQFKKVKNIVLGDEKRRYVVPSAPGKRYKEDQKITDLLYLCHANVEQNVEIDYIFNIIEKRYKELAKELEVSIDIDIELKNIKKNIKNGATADYTASRGEYLNGLILSDYLGYEFVDPAEIIFFRRNGVFDGEKTQEAVSKKLKNIEKAVIPGFYGSLPNGDIKTFSRGGSDVTGAIIARGVNAQLYENWTDVSGFLMVDPNIVENPRNIERITYRELRELAYMGATVLHEEAVFPVRSAGIPINIKNTNRPEDKGTLIIDDLKPASYAGNITGVAGKKDFVVIAIEKNMMNVEQGYCRKVLSILEENDVSFEHMPSGVDAVSLVISKSQLNGKLDSILQEIEIKCKPDSVEVYPDMALVAVVGKGMLRTVGMSAKIFDALAREKVNIRMIIQGSSEINIIVGVENEDFEKAIRAIYAEFTK
ncbi:aspartate kinase [Clostridium cochlearium]|uniref:Aspartokinase n=1 Tax=Clostridium cochlearium TaxID=1494 RepID=A0A240AV97_CLOCO|nr:aspartate kinase [Clostridium cochlearium]NSJ91144.1 aspartate kinase [Coprococcus sp. MSK.21.13]MBE6065838.1 aspartate kinase [Clostridium cochlearium]MBU5268656.1 aspartate kinase [Clostridium cochlearium]MCG4571657.1 aspartate kinase [Clostridium cochlearium]MCR1970940.1 aspartate kinase [Clostridium cochlearium]